MIIVESRLSSRALGRGLEMPLLMSLGRGARRGARRLRRRAPRRHGAPRRPGRDRHGQPRGLLLPARVGDRRRDSDRCCCRCAAVRRNSGAALRRRRAGRDRLRGEPAERQHHRPRGGAGRPLRPAVAGGDHHADAGRHRHGRLRRGRALPADHAAGRGAGARTGPAPRGRSDGASEGASRRQSAADDRREAPATVAAPRRAHGPRARARGRGDPVAADQWSLERQRAQLEGLVGLSADRIAETIHRAAHDGMLRNDAEGVRRIIENIGAPGRDRPRPHLQQGGPRPGVVGAGRGGHARRQAVRGVHRVPLGPAAAGRPRARATAIRMLPRAGRRAHPGHHQPDPQRAGVRRAATSTPPRSACSASSTCGSRWRRPTRRCAPRSARCSRPVRHRPRRAAAELPAAVGASCCGRCGGCAAAMARAGEGDFTARVPVRVERRDGGARPLLERDDRRPAARARGARRPEPHARAARRGEDARSSRRRTTRCWWSRRWPRSASWPRSWRTRSTTRSPASAPTRACCGGSRRGRGRAAPPEQAKETDRILEMVDGEAGRCGDIVRNLLAFSRDSGARFAEDGPRPARRALPAAAPPPGRAAGSRSRPASPADLPQRRVRRGPGPADDARARDERARGDARRTAVSRSRPRRPPTACDPGRLRHGLPGSRASTRPHLRAVLHDQGGGQGRRAGPRGRLRHRDAAPRDDRASQSEPGRGTPFTIRLPAAAGATASRTESHERSMTRTSAADPDRGRRDDRARLARRLVPPGRAPRGHGRGRQGGAAARRGGPLRHRVPRHQDAGHGRARAAGAAQPRPTPS